MVYQRERERERESGEKSRMIAEYYSQNALLEAWRASTKDQTSFGGAYLWSYSEATLKQLWSWLPAVWSPNPAGSPTLSNRGTLMDLTFAQIDVTFDLKLTVTPELTSLNKPNLGLMVSSITAVVVSLSSGWLRCLRIWFVVEHLIVVL